MQDAWEEDREEAANKQFSKANLKSSRRSHRSRRSTRSVTSLKNDAKAVDYSAMYGNSKVFNGDMSFLMTSYDADEDDGFVDDDFINETLNKFVNCVNYLNENSNK